jgi:hypothetical protein
MKVVLLYEVENPHWSADASISSDGQLTISSGDKDSDWYLYVEKDQTNALLMALLQDVTIAARDETDEEDRLLQALKAKFGGSNKFSPYKDIEHFLKRHHIQYRSDAWIG